MEPTKPIDDEIPVSKDSANSYKIKVDKKVLTDFFLLDVFTLEHRIEVEKVISIVLIKHFGKHYNLYDDLRQYAWTNMLEKRFNKAFDETKGNAYNYIYTGCRNEIGNNIIKMLKDTSSEDILGFKEKMFDDTSDELPPEIVKYTKYLTGEQDYEFFRIPKKDVLPLLIYLKIYEKKREVRVPEFVKDSQRSVQVLFKLLKEMFDEQ